PPDRCQRLEQRPRPNLAAPVQGRYLPARPASAVRSPRSSPGAGAGARRPVRRGAGHRPRTAPAMEPEWRCPLDVCRRTARHSATEGSRQRRPAAHRGPPPPRDRPRIGRHHAKTFGGRCVLPPPVVVSPLASLLLPPRALARTTASCWLWSTRFRKRRAFAGVAALSSAGWSSAGGAPSQLYAPLRQSPLQIHANVTEENRCGDGPSGEDVSIVGELAPAVAHRVAEAEIHTGESIRRPRILDVQQPAARPIGVRLVVHL